MERGSDKHGVRMDDSLAHEVDGTIGAGRSSRGEQWRDPDLPGRTTTEVDLRPDGALHGGGPEAMTDQDVELAQRGGAGPWQGDQSRLGSRAGGQGARGSLEAAAGSTEIAVTVSTEMAPTAICGPTDLDFQRSRGRAAAVP